MSDRRNRGKLTFRARGGVAIFNGADNWSVFDDASTKLRLWELTGRESGGRVIDSDGLDDFEAIVIVVPRRDDPSPSAEDLIHAIEARLRAPKEET